MLMDFQYQIRHTLTGRYYLWTVEHNPETKHSSCWSEASVLVEYNRFLIAFRDWHAKYGRQSHSSWFWSLTVEWKRLLVDAIEIVYLWLQRKILTEVETSFTRFVAPEKSCFSFLSSSTCAFIFRFCSSA